uniref:Uncharacterized protein n=1 Tax=Pseudictyota dubia TaxID=2749911 RepID=A0A7R9VEQ2_9STRA
MSVSVSPSYQSAWHCAASQSCPSFFIAPGLSSSVFLSLSCRLAFNSLARFNMDGFPFLLLQRGRALFFLRQLFAHALEALKVSLPASSPCLITPFRTELPPRAFSTVFFPLSSISDYPSIALALQMAATSPFVMASCTNPARADSSPSSSS